jgi:hypothetical protein
VPEPRVVPTAEVLRNLPLYAGDDGWHAHGWTGACRHEACDLCVELARREGITPAEVVAREVARRADPRATFPCPRCRDQDCAGCYGTPCPCVHPTADVGGPS